MQYYNTQGHVTPASVPKPEGNRQYECGSHGPATAQIKTLHLRYIGTDSWSRYVYEDENGRLWKLLDCCSPREVCEQRGDTLHSSCNNAFDGEPDWPMKADIKPEFH